MRVRKIGFEESAGRTEPVVCIRHVQIYFFNPDFQNVTGLGLVNIDRTCEDMPSGTTVGAWYLRIDLLQFGLNLILLRAPGDQTRGIS